MAGLVQAQHHVLTCTSAFLRVVPRRYIQGRHIAHSCRNSQAPILFRAARLLRVHCQEQPKLQGLSAHVHASAITSTDAAEIGDHVKVHYTGILDDGTEFDSSRGKDPLEFVIGAGTVIKGFDLAVMGLRLGEHRKHAVQPADGYGEWRKEMLAKIPTKDLTIDVELQPGMRLRLNSGLEAVVHEKTEDSVTIDANAPLAGKTLHFDVELLQLTKGSTFERATFGAGCFWGPELMFARVPGVVSTATGYSQGDIPSPTYEDVCSGLTGHNEVVQVTYDSKQVSYEQLLQTFVKGHNPTQADGQGHDRGSQYRSGIYTHTPEQKRIAEEFMQRTQADYQDPIATEIEEVKNFSWAEDYHQQYLAKGGRFGRAQSASKGCTDPIRCYG